MEIICDIVVGLQYGDEGKGKVCQELALTPNRYDISAGFNGGPNAGHTSIHNGRKIVLHVVPAGILAGTPVNFIGPKRVVNPTLLRKEIEEIISFGLNPETIYLSELTHLITPFEKRLDLKMNEKIGTTGKGIGPTYAHKAHRFGLRVKEVFSYSENGEVYHADNVSVQDALNSYWIELSSIYKKDWISVEDSELEEWAEAVVWLNNSINIAKANFFLSDGDVYRIFPNCESIRVLIEGAQATMLDNTFGTYSFVSSSNALATDAFSGVGLPGYAKKDRVIGIFKAYSTRVGNGPFDTEIKNSSFGGSGHKIVVAGNEYGSTTGRERRPGWLDIPELKLACELNGVTELIMTKADILSSDVVDDVYVCISKNAKGEPSYSKFAPFETKHLKSVENVSGSLGNFIGLIERRLKIPIGTISVGPNSNDLVHIKPKGLVRA